MKSLPSSTASRGQPPRAVRRDPDRQRSPTATSLSLPPMLPPGRLGHRPLLSHWPGSSSQHHGTLSASHALPAAEKNYPGVAGLLPQLPVHAACTRQAHGGEALRLRPSRRSWALLGGSPAGPASPLSFLASSGTPPSFISPRSWSWPALRSYLPPLQQGEWPLTLCWPRRPRPCSTARCWRRQLLAMGRHRRQLHRVGGPPRPRQGGGAAIRLCSCESRLLVRLDAAASATAAEFALKVKACEWTPSHWQVAAAATASSRANARVRWARRRVALRTVHVLRDTAAVCAVGATAQRFLQLHQCSAPILG